MGLDKYHIVLARIDKKVRKLNPAVRCNIDCIVTL